jgi:hypothetical protein
MKRFENRTIERFYDQDSAQIFEDMEFVRCSFFSSDISIASHPRLRSVIRNVRAIECKVAASFISSAVIEDCEVNGLNTGQDASSVLIVFGAVFNRVTLRGNIGRILFNSRAGGTSFTNQQQAAFDAANAEFYKGVEWALDIRDANFFACDLRSIPARLILRDPETQVVVTKKRLVQSDWEQLDLASTYWPFSLKRLLQSSREDAVLVAPKQDREFRELLKGLQLLRRAGIAEPD